MFHVKQIAFSVIIRGADVRELDIYSIKDMVKLAFICFYLWWLPILRYSSFVLGTFRSNRSFCLYCLYLALIVRRV